MESENRHKMRAERRMNEKPVLLKANANGTQAFKSDKLKARFNEPIKLKPRCDTRQISPNSFDFISQPDKRDERQTKLAYQLIILEMCSPFRTTKATRLRTHR